MDAGTRTPRYADDRYAVQRRAGFPWLRFAPDLEGEFRDSYIDLNATRMRVGSVIGFVGIVGFVILDQFLGSNLLPAFGDAILLLVTIPAGMAVAGLAGLGLGYLTLRLRGVFFAICRGFPLASMATYER